MSTQQKPSSSIRYTPVEGSLTERKNFEYLQRGWRCLLQQLRCGWRSEVLSMLFSFLCTIAAIVILAHMNSQPLSHWTFFLQLNATIALFITLAESTAMVPVASCLGQLKWLHFRKASQKLQEFDLFDDASRGPSGAVLLLQLLAKRRLGFIACIGITATILALGIDTFAQQLVVVDLRSVKIDQNATFGLSYFYDGGAQSDIANSDYDTGFYPISSTVDTGMQGAIYKGVFNINTTAVFKCASACTWNETYSTLGFYSNCSDVTSRIQMNHSSHGYSIRTPGGISLAANYSDTDWQTVVDIAGIDLTMDMYTGNSTSFPVAAEFVRLGIVKVPLNETNFIIDPKTLQIYECTIGFTAYNYSNVFASGNQFIISDKKQIPLNPGVYGQEGQDTVVFNQTGLPVLGAMAPDIGAMVQFFTSDRFSGAIYTGESIPSNPKGVGNVLLDTNVTEAFTNMAESMTEQLRSSSNNTAYGFTITQVQYVQVQWAYLLLPLFVQTLCGVLLILTSLSSQDNHVRLWKSSTVAALYHDIVLEDGSTLLRTNVKSLEQMEELAEQTSARLE